MRLTTQMVKSNLIRLFASRCGFRDYFSAELKMRSLHPKMHVHTLRNFLTARTCNVTCFSGALARRTSVVSLGPVCLQPRTVTRKTSGDLWVSGADLDRASSQSRSSNRCHFLMIPPRASHGKRWWLSSRSTFSPFRNSVHRSSGSSSSRRGFYGSYTSANARSAISQPIVPSAAETLNSFSAATLLKFPRKKDQTPFNSEAEVPRSSKLIKKNSVIGSFILTWILIVSSASALWSREFRARCLWAERSSREVLINYYVPWIVPRIRFACLANFINVNSILRITFFLDFKWDLIYAHG